MTLPRSIPASEPTWLSGKDPVTFRLKITAEARESLIAIAKWYRQTSRSSSVAEAWYDGFLRELDSLKLDATLGRLASENDIFDFELRELP